MKIVIAGAHAVGTHLAKLLAQDNMDVTLMDADESRITQMTFMNLITVVGSPTSINALRSAGVPQCDLFIAVTPQERVNVHACILAANLGARRTVARIDSYEMQKEESAMFYRRIGVSRLVYPEMLGGQSIAGTIKRPWARQSIELCDGHLLLLGVKVRAGAPIVGQSLIEIGKKHHESFHVAAIKRGDDLIIPLATDCIEAEDLVYFFTMPSKADVVRSACGKKLRHLHRVIILGGNRLGVQTCYYLPKDFDVVFIEQDEQRGEYVQERVPKAMMVKGVKGDVETLSELNVDEHDVFVALGDNAEQNILSCLTAKKLGVGKTVVEVNDLEQVTMAQNLNIGSTVNKKMLTASSIYQMLLDADKTSAKCFSLVDAEVADLEARPGSYITSAPVMKLRLPKGITLGGLVRGGKGQTVTGPTQIQAGDHVVVVCENRMIPVVERLFVKASLFS